MFLNPAYLRHWLKDLRYYRACDFFNGRLPPDAKRLSAFNRTVIEQASAQEPANTLVAGKWDTGKKIQ